MGVFVFFFFFPLYFSLYCLSCFSFPSATHTLSAASSEIPGPGGLLSCSHCAESGECTMVSRARRHRADIVIMCTSSGEKNPAPIHDLNEKGKNEAKWPSNLILSLYIVHVFRTTRST
jgi:hypothetical protein